MNELAFRFLLALYPRAFRRRFGDEMLAHMRASHARAAEQGRRVRFWLGLLTDTLRALPTSWSAGASGVRISRQRGSNLAESFATDVRLASRSLSRSPGLATAVIATLGLGIGGSTAVFSIVHGVLLAPLPYPDPDGLVALYQENSAGSRWGFSVADFLAVSEQQRSFAAVAAFVERDVIVADGDEPEWQRAVFVSADYFRVLDIAPVQGRAFAAGDDAAAAPSTVVLGYEIASRLGGAERVVGSTLVLDGAQHTVIGVMPPGVGGIGGRRADLWPVLQLEPPSRRGPFFLGAIARLLPERSLGDAGADLRGISERIFPIWEAGFRDSTARMVPMPMQEFLVGRVRGRLTMLFAAVLLVLLVAVANVSNLLLARAAERQSEMALRTALGAATGRLVRWLIAESLVLATAGTVAGVGLAAIVLATFRQVDTALPRLQEVGLKAPHLAFAAALAAAITLALGLLPMIARQRAELSRSLREGSRTAVDGGRLGSLRSGLVVIELALTVPLLLSAALLMSSLARMQDVDPGYEPANTFAIRISLPTATYEDADAFARFWKQAIADVSEVPGVVAAGAGNILPPDASGFSNNFDLEDRPVSPGEPEPASPWALVTGPFLEALGTELIDGRLFTPDEFAGIAPPVVVVSESWARRFFPDDGAVGKRLFSGGDHETPVAIVGVVGDVKFSGLAGDGEAVYGTAVGGWLRSLNLLVRTRGDTANVLAAVRQRLRRVDAGLPLTDVQSLQDRLDDEVAAPRQWTLLLIVFASTATVLSIVGIFGVVSHAVRGRTREIGLRMAMGASGTGIVVWVIRSAMLRVLAGLAAGLGLSAVALRFLQGFLFGVDAGDPLHIGGVCLLLAAVSLLACWLPGRRAATVDPVTALSGD